MAASITKSVIAGVGVVSVIGVTALVVGLTPVSKYLINIMISIDL